MSLTHAVNIQSVPNLTQIESVRAIVSDAQVVIALNISETSDKLVLGLKLGYSLVSLKQT